MTGTSVEPETRPFRVLMTSGVFEPGFRGGGPIRSIARIVDTAPADIDVLLVTSDRDLGESAPYPGLSGRWVPRGRAQVFYLDTGSIQQWLRLWRTVRSMPLDLLYVNSLWAPKFSILPILAVLTNMVGTRNVLIAPRGELSAGAVSLKARKKRNFLKIWSRLLRRLDLTWHASTAMECMDIKAVFPGAAVETIENQTALPEVPLPVGQSRPGPARLVFVSRIAPMKNLDIILSALGQVKAPVDLDIYGPLEDRVYWRRCERIIATHPPHVRARYRGVLAPSEVRGKFAEYDLFAFPTKGENFGHVMAESLSASCPIVCSDRTPWTELLRMGGGFIVEDVTPQALAAELGKVAGMSPEERVELRRRAGQAYRTWRSKVVEENILAYLSRRRQSTTETFPYSGSHAANQFDEGVNL